MKKILLVIIVALCVLFWVNVIQNWTTEQDKKFRHETAIELMFVANKVGPRR